MCGVPPKVSDPKNSRQASPFLDFHFHVRFKKSFFWRLVAECPRGGCGCGLVMVEYITPRILPNGLIFEIYILNLKYSIPSFQHQFKLTQCLFLCGTRPNLIEDRLILIKKTQGISQIHLLHGLSTPACPFFGVWPVATGVVMVEYITPPDLPLMDSQLGSS